MASDFGLETTSSVSEGHTHTLCLLTADLMFPPEEGGQAFPTSTTSQHTHAVTLNSAQLSAIQTGSTVTVDSSNAVDPLTGVPHTHSFVIVLAAQTP